MKVRDGPSALVAIDEDRFLGQGQVPRSPGQIVREDIKHRVFTEGFHPFNALQIIIDGADAMPGTGLETGDIITSPDMQGDSRATLDLHGQLSILFLEGGTEHEIFANLVNVIFK